MCKQPVLAFYCSRPLIYEGPHIGFQFHEGNSEFNSEESNSDSNSNSNDGNSNSIPIPPGLSKANSNSYSNSGIGLGISKKIQFRSGIDPDSATYHRLQNGTILKFLLMFPHNKFAKRLSAKSSLGYIYPIFEEP